MTNQKASGQSSKSAIILTWCLVGIEAVSLASSLMQLELLQRVRTEVIPDAVYMANDLRETIIGGIHSVVYLAWIVIFMIWFYRALANLQARVSYPLSYKPGWAVANFFVPVVSLYRPYQTMKELYVDTRDLLVKNGLSEKKILSTHHLGWWWALWLITGITAHIILKASFQEFETLDQIISLTVTQIIDAALNILCALLTITVIRNYSRVEPLLGEIEENTASGPE